MIRIAQYLSMKDAGSKRVTGLQLYENASGKLRRKKPPIYRCAEGYLEPYSNMAGSPATNSIWRHRCVSCGAIRAASRYVLWLAGTSITTGSTPVPSRICSAQVAATDHNGDFA